MAPGGGAVIAFSAITVTQGGGRQRGQQAPTNKMRSGAWPRHLTANQVNPREAFAQFPTFPLVASNYFRGSLSGLRINKNRPFEAMLNVRGIVNLSPVERWQFGDVQKYFAGQGSCCFFCSCCLVGGSAGKKCFSHFFPGLEPMGSTSFASARSARSASILSFSAGTLFLYVFYAILVS